MKDRTTSLSHSGNTFTLSRTFDAPRELVFKVWTSSEHICNWWGPRIMKCPVAGVDLREGGKFSYVMQDSNGIDYPMDGIFTRVIPNELLESTIDLTGHPSSWHNLLRSYLKNDAAYDTGMTMNVKFEDAGNGTKLTVTQTFASEEMLKAFVQLGHNEGWSQTIERFDEIVHRCNMEKNSADAAREIVQVRIVNAPAALVFDCFTKQEHIIHWWGPDGFTNTIYEMDVRAGGKWKFMMHGPNNVDYPNFIRYTRIEPPHLIEFDHSGEENGPEHYVFHTTIRLEPLGNKTRVTLKALFSSVQMREESAKFGAIEGGKQTLRKLDEYLAALH